MTKEAIAKTLKEKRIKAGLEAKEVAEKLIELGAIKSIKSFYNWESGRTQPDADTFMYLCNLYKIDSVMETFGYEQKQIVPNDSHEVTTAYENADFETKNNVRFLLKLPLLSEEMHENSQSDQEYVEFAARGGKMRMEKNKAIEFIKSAENAPDESNNKDLF